MKAIKTLVAALILMLAFESKGQYVAIPDSNFAYGLLASGYSGCLTGSNASGWYLDTACAVVTSNSINCAGYNVHDLTGIQYLSNLVFLDCSNNPGLIVPTLPASLATLICLSNQWTSLPNLPASLTTLQCNYNQLNTLPALPSYLSFLDCSYNHLNTLPALPSYLYYLDCRVNHLTSLTNIPYSLFNFDCSGNSNLTCLPNPLPSMGTFSIDGTGIQCMPNRFTYTLLFGAIQEPDSLPLCTPGNVNGCPVYISAGSDQAIHVGDTLSMAGSGVGHWLAAAGNTSPVTFDHDSLPNTVVRGFTHVGVDTFYYTDGTNTDMMLVNVTAMVNNYVLIPDSSFGKWLNSYGYTSCMSGNSSTGWYLDTTCTQVLNDTIIDCGGSSITDLSGIQYFRSLNHLVCDNNQLSSLTNLPVGLTYLSCRYNQFSSLPSLPTGLTQLWCADNQLTSLPSLPVGLIYLYCDNNNLGSLPSLPAGLISLGCGYNQISSLTSLPHGLTNLYCNNNQLSSLPNLPAVLTYLYCSTNQLSSLSSLPAGLNILDCSDNQLTSLPGLPTGLIYLGCGYNQLNSLPNLPAGLTSLNCYNNHLISLPSLPTGLIELVCSHNINLSCLPHISTNLLSSFYIDSTNIQCMPNYFTATNYDIRPDSLPICGVGNVNGCHVYTISAGPDTSIHVGDTLSMAGSGVGHWLAAAGNTSPVTFDHDSLPNTVVRGFTHVGVDTFYYTDGVTTDTMLVTVTSLCNVLANAGLDSTICVGSSVVLGGSPTASGGSGGYTYSWSPNPALSNPSSANPTASGLAATTTFHVTVTDGLGCSATDTVRVVVAPNPIADAGSNQIICFGAGVVIGGSPTASGGSGSYTYTWSPGIGLNASNVANPTASPVPNTTYTVTVSDIVGCTATASVMVTVATQPSVSITPSASHICTGSSISLSVAFGGTGPWSYAIDTIGGNVSGSTSSSGMIVNVTPRSGRDTFGISCSSAGCAAVHDSTVVSTDVSFTVNQRASCPPMLLQMQAPTGATGTNWIITPPSGAVQTFTNQNTASYIIPDSGRAIVTMTTAQGCNIVDSNFHIYGKPKLRGGLSADSIVQGHCVYWNDSSLSFCGRLTYQISWGSGPLDTLPGVCHTFSAAGLVSPSIVITNSCGCQADTTLTNALRVFSLDTVWPGDADANRLVDNNDLLPIGLAYDSIGPVRTVQGIFWQGDAATDWAHNFTQYAPLVNFKHADCNGDGIVNAADTTAIMQNFGQTHNKTNTHGQNRAGQPLIYPTLSSDTVTNGDSLLIRINLGQVILAATNVYGVAFTLNYDAAVIDTTQTTMSFPTSWFGGPTDKISLYKDLKGQGMIKAAMTRIDHTARSGYGEIAYVRAIVTTDNIDGKNLRYYKFLCSISDVTIVDLYGNVIPVNEGTDSNQVAYVPLGIADVSDLPAMVSLYPNPANDKVTIACSSAYVIGADILNVLGEKVREYTYSDYRHERTLDMQGLSSGVYHVSIRTASGTVIKKVLINH